MIDPLKGYLPSDIERRQRLDVAALAFLALAFVTLVLSLWWRYYALMTLVSMGFFANFMRREVDD